MKYFVIWIAPNYEEQIEEFDTIREVEDFLEEEGHNTTQIILGTDISAQFNI
jgi:hypothetical protein